MATTSSLGGFKFLFHLTVRRINLCTTSNLSKFLTQARCKSAFSLQLRKMSSSVFLDHYTAAPYGLFDVLISDITEKELVDLGSDERVEKLSKGCFSSTSPMKIWKHGINLRLVPHRPEMEKLLTKKKLT